MNIAPVSAVVLNSNLKLGTDKKAEPKAEQPKAIAVQNSGSALRSYFMGGQAVSFGFNCNTGDFVTKEFEDVPCCCCGGRQDAGVFNTLLFESGQTIEHVHPHSRGGKNDTDNYLAECGECNHKRGNVSYMTWLKIHPEYPVNVQKHIEWFQQQQVDGKIGKEYDDYGVKIKQTLSKESNGVLELKVLDKAKIVELREKAQAGEEVNVHEEIKKKEEEQA